MNIILYNTHKSFIIETYSSVEDFFIEFFVHAILIVWRRLNK